MSTLKKLFFSSLFVLFSFGIFGCQTGPMPVDEYALARVALDAAREVQAARLSPGFWNQAEEAFRKGKLLYRDSRWDEARIEFIIARSAAEKAENFARLTRQKTGDIL